MVTKLYDNGGQKVVSDSQGPASMGMMVGEVRSGSESESMRKEFVYRLGDCPCLG